MNTKSDGISSGLVAVAFGQFLLIEGGDVLMFPLFGTREGAERDLFIYAEADRKCLVIDGVVRLSDAEAIILAKDAEIERLTKRIGGEDSITPEIIQSQAERIKELIDISTQRFNDWSEAEARVVAQSAALKLARNVIEVASDAYNLCWKSGMPIIDPEMTEALAAIDALKGE